MSLKHTLTCEVVLRPAVIGVSHPQYVVCAEQAAMPTGWQPPPPSFAPGERRRCAVELFCQEWFNVGNTNQPEFFDRIRRALGSALFDARAQKITAPELAILLPDNCSDLEELIETVAETIGLALFQFEYEYDSIKFFPEKVFPIEKVLIQVVPEIYDRPRIHAAFSRGLMRADAGNFARWLSHLPANFLTPNTLCQFAIERLGKCADRMAILDESELARQGFGGIVAVGKGGQNKPRLGIFEYNPAEAKKTIVLVGKGVTFDTGGYSIKTSAHMNLMKFDMCGAANVLAAFEILANEKINARVIALIPCAENMIDGEAQRPGDVYKTWNGKLVEVFSTDAEGRLLLADALSFSTTFSPNLVIDLATLTGGAARIAGNMAGIMCMNDEKFIPLVRKSSKQCGEQFVYLEILPQVRDDFVGRAAHYININGNWGTGAGTMLAGSFLREFIPNGVDWLHLDIANVAHDAKENGYMDAKGALAYGTRTIVNFVKNYLQDEI